MSNLTYGFVEARDVSRVLDSLGERESSCVGVYGFSYGASVAILLTARDARLKAVVAAAPFSSLEEVARDYERKYLPVPLNLIPHAWFQGGIDEGGRLAAFDPEGVAPVRLVRQSTADLLLIHGAADDQVPLRHSVMLAEAAGSRAKLLALPRVTHDDMPRDSSGAVRRATIAWFDRSLSGDACSV
jgi:dipeptidyl aminopeptidase/acylaminoacyl peptidase